MTGKTHKAGGFLCSVVGFALLRKNGLLIDGVSEPLQWLIMYPFCYWGSVASDLDHHKDSIPMKDPPSILINKALHITAPLKKSLEKAGDTKSPLYKFAKTFNASHRSWQTHSDLTLFVLLYLVHMLLSGGLPFGAVDSVLLSLVLMGISLGLIAHFILDMLTTDGVWSILLVVLGSILGKVNPRLKKAIPMKLRLVPRWHMFRTDGSWEAFVLKVLRVLSVFGVIYLLWGILGLGKLIPWQVYLTP